MAVRPERSCPFLSTLMEVWKSGVESWASSAEGLAHLGKSSPLISRLSLLPRTDFTVSKSAFPKSARISTNTLKSLSVSSLPGLAARGDSCQQISQLYRRLGKVWFPQKFGNGLRLQLKSNPVSASRLRIASMNVHCNS